MSKADAANAEQRQCPIHKAPLHYAGGGPDWPWNWDCTASGVGVCHWGSATLSGVLVDDNTWNEPVRGPGKGYLTMEQWHERLRRLDGDTRKAAEI